MTVSPTFTLLLALFKCSTLFTGSLLTWHIVHVILRGFVTTSNTFHAQHFILHYCKTHSQFTLRQTNYLQWKETQVSLLPSVHTRSLGLLLSVIVFLLQKLGKQTVFYSPLGSNVIVVMWILSLFTHGWRFSLQFLREDEGQVQLLDRLLEAAGMS